MSASHPKNAASGDKPRSTSAQDPVIGAFADPARAADAHVIASLAPGSTMLSALSSSRAHLHPADAAARDAHSIAISASRFRTCLAAALHARRALGSPDTQHQTSKMILQQRPAADAGFVPRSRFTRRFTPLPPHRLPHSSRRAPRAHAPRVAPVLKLHAYAAARTVRSITRRTGCPSPYTWSPPSTPSLSPVRLTPPSPVDAPCAHNRHHSRRCSLALSDHPHGFDTVTMRADFFCYDPHFVPPAPLRILGPGTTLGSGARCALVGSWRSAVDTNAASSLSL
ncbi:hypothetical protein HYPSUDRAFT_207642 [Hypholoma sublateritium FD-334 SS-4]|uniref:Uncharacterized protein n=1 Tax=Hypholoma sublateritium (strain FD-334 SS-4) TaxID=945553 RepID=A0A0D2KMB5_HYPSF|nr:hypothetical protein HYPSUDRAFT_207642 [Hypholoma sublateritium FD-334 SS-4]